MIELSETNITQLKHLIINDFYGVVDDAEKECNELLKIEHTFYVWKEDVAILGYMGIVRFPHMIFCSFTKVYDRKIYKKMYKKFKELYNEAEDNNIPLVTDGTNFMHCKNHVEPIYYGENKLYRWNLSKPNK